MFVVVNGACMPALFPLRAWTLPVRYDISPPNAGMAVKTHTEVAKKANPRLLYIALPFGAVSRIIHSDQFTHSASITLTARDTSIFYAQPFFNPTGSSYLYLFSLSQKRFSEIITLQKPSKETSRPPPCLES